MTATDIPEPSAPPPVDLDHPSHPPYVRPNAHIRPLHLSHLSDSQYDPHPYHDSEPVAPPSPPPNHYQHHSFNSRPPPPPPPRPQEYSSVDTATTTHSTHSDTSPTPFKSHTTKPLSMTPEPVINQPAQTTLPKPAVASHQEDTHPFCYVLLGALLALFFNIFAFLFLCCPSGMGIHGRRRPSFVAGVLIGAAINAAGIACFYYYVVRPLVDDL